MVISWLYFGYQHSPYVHAALRGCAAAAVGISSANAAELSRRSLRRPVALAFLVATAVAVSIFHVSLILVLLTLGVASVGFRLLELLRR